MRDDVQFDQSGTFVSQGRRKRGGLTGWAMRAGLAKTQKGAERVLVVLALLALTAAVIVWMLFINEPPVPVVPRVTS